MTAPTFTFQPRWKEELVCRSALGTFILEMPMGIVSVYVPTESSWKQRAPAWARNHWDTVYVQLQAWCRANKIPLHIDESAGVYTE
jgi:hypothetical protein